MDTFLRILPFAAAESLLVWSVWRLRRITFIASFLVLTLACGYAVMSESSSGIFNFIGGCLIVFGVTCIYLGERVGVGAFVSRSGLRAIGALLFFLGVFGLFIV